MAGHKSIKRTSRRSLLVHGGQAIAAALLAGCAPSEAALLLSQSPGTRLHFPSIPTMPAGNPRPAVLPQPSLDAKIGQMLLVGFRGRAISEKSQIVRDIREQQIGSVVLFEYNTERSFNAARQIRALTSALQAASSVPLFISIDQEGGRVSRLSEAYGFPRTVSAAYLGVVNDQAETYTYASATADTLNDLGINLNLAPVVDLNTNPANPIIARYERSFSADPQMVVHHASTFIEAHHERNILCTLKHFPGHGSSQRDSHRGFVDVTETWSVKELVPYLHLIANEMADVIMTAHIFNARLDANVPATLSHAVITGILREQLGYDGVIMSDDMQMGAIASRFSLEEAVQAAVLAGVDIIALGNNVTFSGRAAVRAANAIHQMLDAGEIDESRIDASYRRIMRLKERIA